MNYFRWYRIATCLLLGFNLVFAQAMHPNRGYREFFPFFHWSLFSGHAREMNLFQVSLTYEAEGKVQVCRLQECPKAGGELKSKRFFFLVQKLGEMLEIRELRKADLIRQFEAQLRQHSSPPVRYSVNRVKVDILVYAASSHLIPGGEVVLQGVIP